MSKKTFTPAPWFMNPNFRVVDKNRRIIADCKFGVKSSEILQESVENARLIAQAPALLESLQHILEFIGQYGIHDSNGKSMAEDISLTVDIAEAAIKKATQP